MLEMSTPDVFVQGQITDSKMRPIDAATIAASDSVSTSRQRTGESGRFRLGPYPPDARLDLHASAEGYAESRLDAVLAPVNGLDVILYRNGSLRGRVLADASGTPISTFAIELLRAEDLEGRFDLPDTAGQWKFENEDGRFELEDVAPGEWSVIAAAEGYQLGVARGLPLREGPSTEDVVLLLTEGRRLRGVVIDEATRLPIVSATVRDISDYVLQRPSVLRRAAVDGPGRRLPARRPAAG
jgi:Carboxypeptidase regulatory-like domain